MPALLTHRDLQPEVMDQPGLDPESHRIALAALGRINQLSRTGDAVWTPVRRLAEAASRRPLRLLDVACGGGDVLRSLATRARRAGLPIELHGCDLSPRAIEFAATQTRKQGLADIAFFERDVLKDGLPDGYDVITCTLFLHHLTHDEAVGLLSTMKSAARRMVVVDDLRRTRFGYLLASVGGRLLTRSPVVHDDGPQSVKAAFTMQELRELADRAGLGGATIRPHWPQRMTLTWERPS